MCWYGEFEIDELWRRQSRLHKRHGQLVSYVAGAKSIKQFVSVVISVIESPLFL